MIYNGEYINPPRPNVAVPPAALPQFEQKGDYFAQIKKEGTFNIIFVRPDRTVFAMNRHRGFHSKWAFSKISIEPFTKLPGNNWMVLCAELLHSRVKYGIRDTNYIHDILVYNGRYTKNMPYAARYGLLLKLFVIKDEMSGYYLINSNTWLTKNYTQDFFQIFNNLQDPHDEGIVLKYNLGDWYNNNGMYKCRRPSKYITF